MFIDGAGSEAARPVAQAMEDLLLAQLSDAEAVTLVERSSIAQVLKEQQLALSGLVDPATAARIGQLLKADVIVVGRVRSLAGTERLATLCAVAVGDARVLWSGEAQGDDGALAGQAASIGGELAGALRHDGGTAMARAASPLVALKHHERATALRALGALEEAATEELLALHHDPLLADADLGFLTALADAGFERLAAVQAEAELAGPGDHHASAQLKALAGRTGMPTASHREEAVDSLETQSVRRFAELMTRRAQESPPEEAGRRAQDEIRAWVLLGDAYVAEQRDRLARAAYQHALTRLWTLRALDPLCAAERTFAFPRCCDSAAGRAIELAAIRRYDLAIGPVFDPLLLPTLREALAKKQALPAGAKLPLPVYRCELPFADRVLLPGARGSTEMDVLLRLDLAGLPANAVFADASIVGPLVTLSAASIASVTTRWVGSEADFLFARSGTPWPARGPFGNDPVRGRTVFANEQSQPHGLLACLAEALRRGADDHGMVMVGGISRHPAAMPEMHVLVDLVAPGGTAASLKPSPHACIAAGVYHLLAGDAAQAMRAFDAASSAVLIPAPTMPGSQLTALVAGLKALCEGRP